jgi:hypothetical protein
VPTEAASRHNQLARDAGTGLISGQDPSAAPIHRTFAHCRELILTSPAHTTDDERRTSAMAFISVFAATAAKLEHADNTIKVGRSGIPFWARPRRSDIGTTSIDY